jgi:hypothetical protein
MAAPTNTATSLVSIGNREDLEDVIYRVAPEETPLISNIGSVKATGTYHEWQTESLSSPSATNAQLEGDDISSLDAPNLTTRVGNYCQILRKAGGVSRTEELVKKAGRTSEMNRQKTLKGIEAKRDLEMRSIGNYASNVESGGSARKLGGALAWLVSNVSRGTGGSSGGFAGGTVSVATNGTQRTLTEALVKNVLASAFANGGHPKQAYMGPADKQVFSAFTGIAQIRKDVPSDDMATIIGAADVYVSDFGNLALIPHPYGLSRDVLIVDPDMMAIGTLDGWKSEPLAKTGDSERFLLTAEKTLVVKNEKAHAVIADVN